MNLVGSSKGSVLVRQFKPWPLCEQPANMARRILGFTVRQGYKRVMMTKYGGVCGAQPVDKAQISEMPLDMYFSIQNFIQNPLPHVDNVGFSDCSILSCEIVGESVCTNLEQMKPSQVQNCRT